MKTSMFTLAVAAVLALGACSSGDSEPTKTVTKTAAAEESAANSNTRDRVETADDSATEDAPKDGAVGDIEEGGEGDLWGDLPIYTDAYALSQAIGANYWEVDPDGFTEFDCIKANQQISQERDEYSGEVVDVTSLECSRKGTSEYVTLTVMTDYDDESEVVVPACDEYLEGDTCFTGRGWSVDAENNAMLKEVLEKIDVDHKAWGVGEDLGYDY